MRFSHIYGWISFVHRKLRWHALGAARFLTLTGTTRGQRAFWRIGAAISAFGGLVVIASELGTVAALLTLAGWRSAGGVGLIALHITIPVLVGYFVGGLIRAIREPLGLGLPGGPKP